MITDDYKKQLRLVHEGRSPSKPWGTTGERNAGHETVRFIRRRLVFSVLDFGCGTGSLGDYIRSCIPDIQVIKYDPGIPGLDRLPDQEFDAIVSADVLEHVEPEQINETLAWMRDHARVCQFHHIACCKDGTILPDGRNAHLIVEDPGWWRAKFIQPGWEIQYYADLSIRRRGMMRRAAQIAVDRVP